MNLPSAHSASDVRDKILDAGQRIMAGKGYTAVGLNEILVAARVPKGSFYHYFGSKEAFGEALLDRYFAEYLAEFDDTLRLADATMAARLMRYWRNWRENQSVLDCQGRCLAVKLGAEVADLSETMRLSLQRGTAGIVERIARAIRAGLADGSLSIDGDPEQIAESLYQLWMGASVMAKIVRGTRPFDTAMATTRQVLRMTG